MTHWSTTSYPECQLIPTVHIIIDCIDTDPKPPGSPTYRKVLHSKTTTYRANMPGKENLYFQHFRSLSLSGSGLRVHACSDGNNNNRAPPVCKISGYPDSQICWRTPRFLQDCHVLHRLYIDLWHGCPQILADYRI